MNVRRTAAAIAIVSTTGVALLATAQPASAAVRYSVHDVPYAPGATFNSPLAASADVDGDGRDDVVVAQGDAIVVYRGQATAGLAAPVRTPFASAGNGTAWTRVFAAGDLTGDGAADLVVAESTGPNTSELVVLHSNGADGTFGAPSAIDGPLPATAQVSVTIGDVEGDGNADVLVTRGTGFPGTTSLHHNSGDGALADPVLLGSTGFSPRLVDVDSDGADDLVGWDASVVTDDQLRAFVADPSEPVAAASYADLFSVAAGTDGLLAQVVDLTGDGHADLVTADGTEGGFAPSTGPGTFATATPIGFGTLTSAAPDVDDDGDRDLLTFDALGALRVAVNDGTGAFALETLRGLPAGSLITGDFDGDERLQLAVLHDVGGDAPTISVVTFATPISCRF